MGLGEAVDLYALRSRGDDGGVPIDCEGARAEEVEAPQLGEEVGCLACEELTGEIFILKPLVHMTEARRGAVSSRAETTGELENVQDTKVELFPQRNTLRTALKSSPTECHRLQAPHRQ